MFTFSSLFLGIKNRRETNQFAKLVRDKLAMNPGVFRETRIIASFLSTDRAWRWWHITSTWWAMRRDRLANERDCYLGLSPIITAVCCNGNDLQPQCKPSFAFLVYAADNLVWEILVFLLFDIFVCSVLVIQSANPFLKLQFNRNLPLILVCLSYYRLSSSILFPNDEIVFQNIGKIVQKYIFLARLFIT